MNIDLIKTMLFSSKVPSQAIDFKETIFIFSAKKSIKAIKYQ
jgi:hypothetical protein